MSILTTADPKKKLEQPPWVQPTGGVDVGLKVFNSLTSKLEPFIPQEGRVVRWYICGPTVYDSAHLGHAMTYITFDIIRRILEDYFNYEVFFVMNITDVDDKIIVRARRNYLMKQFMEKRKATGWDEEILIDIKKALDYYIKDKDRKLGVLEQEDIKHSTGKINKKELEADLSIAAAKQYSARDKLSAISSKSIEELNKTIPDPVQFAYDPLVEYLDALHGPSLSNETMREAIREHASKFESDFFREMDMLNVKSPDVLTRVSDYIPEIEQMVLKIIENGYAYESSGSVYFNTGKFDPSLVNANPPDNHHFYGKLEPWSIGNRKLHQDGEGVLMKDVPEHDKRSPIDFALWKKSKPGEPGWNTSFGHGRPGWHIECSAMASTILGNTIDIHSGGEDLRFPHHDNELAQSEAYFGTHQWVNYFFHTGHLNIEGLKMSKSLKNFITIKEILDEYTPFQIRMLYLTQPWGKSFNFRKDSLDKAKNSERYFLAFLSKVSTLATDKAEQSKSQKWTAVDVELNDLLRMTQRLVHERLLDNFDTPGVITALLDLINKSNVYLTSPDRKVLLLTTVSAYVEKMLKIFGLITEEDQADAKNIARPIVQQFCDLRNEVRTAAKEKKSASEVLSITDKYSDQK